MWGRPSNSPSCAPSETLLKDQPCTRLQGFWSPSFLHLPQNIVPLRRALTTQSLWLTRNHRCQNRCSDSRSQFSKRAIHPMLSGLSALAKSYPRTRFEWKLQIIPLPLKQYKLQYKIGWSGGLRSKIPVLVHLLVIPVTSRSRWNIYKRQVLYLERRRISIEKYELLFVTTYIFCWRNAYLSDYVLIPLWVVVYVFTFYCSESEKWKYPQRFGMNVWKGICFLQTGSRANLWFLKLKKTSN